MHAQSRDAREGAIADDIAQAYGITAEQARIIVREVGAEFSRRLAQITLSRGGLADIVAALGDPRVLEDGNAALALVLGSKDRSRAVAARAGKRAAVDAARVQQMLPAIAQSFVGAMSASAKPSLTETYSRMPSLGRLSRGSMHADIADVLRRGCGSGPWGPAVFRRRVRGILARAGRYSQSGLLSWYLGYLLTPARIVLSKMPGRARS